MIRQRVRRPKGRPAKPHTTLGSNIDSRRRMLRMTVEDLAERAGVNRRTITRLSQGEASTTIDTLAALANVLECQMWELLKPGTFQG